MFHVYIIKSNTDKHYIGFTSNLTQRLAQHNRKHHGSTYGTNLVWEILISHPFPTKREAMHIEKLLKSFKNYRRAFEFLQQLKLSERSASGGEVL
ncbi:MAG: GIY-YIG nuclease family protein, partial [Ignavibacteria bacterium]|nr:GIY-YIG nuclease family protein [Ignavibacteria bacterium]